MSENLSPQEAAAEIERITSDPKYYQAKDPNVSQKEAERVLELQRIADGATNRPILEVDGKHVRSIPAPTDAPLPLPETWPSLQLPPSVPANHPALQEAREMAFYADMPAGILQDVISAAVRVLQERPPLTQAEVDRAEGVMLDQVRAKYGSRASEWADNLDAGEAIAESHPALRQLLNDPRTWSSFELRDALAQLGAQASVYYTRKVGRKKLFTV